MFQPRYKQGEKRMKHEGDTYIDFVKMKAQVLLNQRQEV